MQRRDAPNSPQRCVATQISRSKGRLAAAGRRTFTTRADYTQVTLALLQPVPSRPGETGRIRLSYPELSLNLFKFQASRSRPSPAGSRHERLIDEHLESLERCLHLWIALGKPEADNSVAPVDEIERTADAGPVVFALDA